MGVRFFCKLLWIPIVSTTLALLNQFAAERLCVRAEEVNIC